MSKRPANKRLTAFVRQKPARFVAGASWRIVVSLTDSNRKGGYDNENSGTAPRRETQGQSEARAQTGTIAEQMSGRSLVEPLIAPDDVFVQKWLEEHRRMAAERPNPYPVTEEFVTNNGEIVRSKSEKIIADLLLKLGIPYVYECPLDTPGGTIYPDFTILDITTRETYYWEHRGRMDKPDYVEKNLWKEHLYALQGIFPGQKLLFSEESDTSHLRTVDVEAMIRTLFLDRSF